MTRLIKATASLPIERLVLAWRRVRGQIVVRKANCPFEATAAEKTVDCGHMVIPLRDFRSVGPFGPDKNETLAA